IAGSDFSRSFIVGYGSSPARRGPAALDRAVERELSRFPATRSVCTCQVLRPRRAAWALAMSRPCVLPSAFCTASAPRTNCLSRLDGWPMHSPTDASPVPSQAPAHGSGPMRFATPSSWRTFTAYSLPVSPAHTKRNLQILRSAAIFRTRGCRGRIVFLFARSVDHIVGDLTVEALELVVNDLVGQPGRRIAVPTEERARLPCGMVIRSVGYRARPPWTAALAIREEGLCR